MDAYAPELPTPFASLTEDERTTLTSALHIAAERYDENALAAKPVTPPGRAPRPGVDRAPFSPFSMGWIAAQFTRQAEEARRLARLIEDT